MGTEVRAAPTGVPADATPSDEILARTNPRVEAAISDYCRGRITDSFLGELVFGTAWPGGLAICEVCRHRPKSATMVPGVPRWFRGRMSAKPPFWPYSAWHDTRDIPADRILVGVEEGRVVACYLDKHGRHELLELVEEVPNG